VYNSTNIEDRNKPVVALINGGFASDAVASASNKKMSGLRTVLLDKSIPQDCTVVEQIEAGVAAAMDDIVAALTKPLTEEEKSPTQKKAEKLPRIVFKGDFDEVNRFSYRRGWTDGLPVVPPTEEAVKEMLTGTDLPADHVVGKIPSMLGKATVEKIAVNAVMAGCLPTYMPVLIAATEAIVDPMTIYEEYATCTGSNGPLWVLNGPIRDDLNVSSGTCALSRTEIPSAAIPRAMGLIIQNIGGFRNGMEAMGVVGSVGRYHMLVAENEEESPWEPLHVEHGLEKDDSAVGLFFPNSFIQTGVWGSDADSVMRTIVQNNFNSQRGLFCYIMPPANANTLADAGWTKQGVREFISEHARVPVSRDLPLRWEESWPLGPMDTRRIMPTDWIRIIVAGGAGTWGVMCAGSLPLGAKWVSKKVQLPANWKKLVAKYKDVVPMHVRY